MVNICSVCEKEDKYSKTYHFPKKRRAEWDAVVPLPNWVSDEYSVLCEKHFDVTDFTSEPEQNV